MTSASQDRYCATGSGRVGPRCSWPDPTEPSGSMSRWSTTLLRSTRDPCARVKDRGRRPLRTPCGPGRRPTTRLAGAGARDIAEVGVGIEPLTIAVLGVAGGGEAGVHDRAFVSGDGPRARLPTVSSAPLDELTLGWDGRHRVRQGRTGGQGTVELVDQQVGHLAGDVGVVGAGTRRAMRTIASSVIRPCSNSAQHAGSSCIRRATCTSPWLDAGTRPPSSTPSARATGSPSRASRRCRATCGWCPPAGRWRR